MEDNYEKIMGKVYNIQERFTNGFSKKMEELEQKQNVEELEEDMIKLDFAVQMVESQKEIIEYIDSKMEICTENDKERLQKEKEKFVSKKIEDEEMTINALKNIAREVNAEKTESEKILNQELIKLQEQKIKAVKRVDDYFKRTDIGYDEKQKANLIKEDAVNKIQEQIDTLINKQKEKRQKLAEYDEKIDGYSEMLNIESDIEKIRNGEEQPEQDVETLNSIDKNNMSENTVNKLNEVSFDNNPVSKNKKTPKKDKETVKHDRIFITINEGKLQYQYEDNDENIKMFDILDYNKKVKVMQKIEEKVYDPFLKEFLVENNDMDLLNTIKGQLGYKDRALYAIRDRFVYDMAESEDLGFKARRQLRKMVKMLKKSGLNVENEESIKFSLKNDILKGLGNLFKGTMKGALGKAETPAMLHASRQQDLSNEQMDELIKRDRNNDWVKIQYPTEKAQENNINDPEIEGLQKQIIRAKQQVDEAKKQKMEEMQNKRDDSERGE